jgi:recombination protein RecT
MAQELTPYQQKAISIREWLGGPGIAKQLQAALPKFLTMERFLRSFYTAILRNEKLLDCSKESMLSAMITAAQLGMEPILNKAALIPYAKEVQFQPMYKGYMDLARRVDEVKIVPHVVYEHDDFEIRYGLNEDLIHKPAEGDRGKARGAYVVWTWEDGLQSFYYMSTAEINRTRDKYSKAYNYAMAHPKDAKAQETPWITSWSAMAKKTVIKMSSKYEPSSHELALAVELDSLSEAGKSQQHLLNMAATTGGGFQFPAAAAPDEQAPADEKPPDEATGVKAESAEILAGRWDRALESIVEYDKEALQEYLELALKGAAKDEGRSVSMAELKASIMQTSFKNFWTYFEKWAKDRGTKKGTKEPITKDSDAKLIAEIKRASKDRLISWAKSHKVHELSEAVQKAYSEKWAKYQGKDDKGQSSTGEDPPPEKGPEEGDEEVVPTEEFPIRCHNTQIGSDIVKPWYCEHGCRYREGPEGDIICNDYFTYMEKMGLAESHDEKEGE